MASKKSKDNPTSSTILQVLLDLKNRGYGDMTAAEMIDLLNDDKDLLNNLDKQWNNRLYSDKSITWASISILPGLMNLSPEALKVLILLGIYADQTSLIRVTRNVIMQATGIKLTTLKTTLRELEECGAIKIEIPSVGHKAPIYKVNGDIIAVGRRNKIFGFSGDPDKYILKQQLHMDGLRLVANRHTDKQADGTKIMYHELILAPVNKNEPLDTESAPKGSSKKSSRNNHSSKSNHNGQVEDITIPGQLTFKDIGLE